MKSLQSLLPSKPSPWLDQAIPLLLWQEKLLQTTLLLASLLGLVFSLTYQPTGSSTSGTLFLVGSLLLTVASTVLFALRSLSFRIRVLLTLTVLFIFMQSAFLRSGWGTPALLLLLVYSCLCSAWLGSRSLVSALGLCVLSLTIWASLSMASASVAGAFDLSVYLIGILLIVVCGTILNLLLHTLLTRLMQAGTDPTTKPLAAPTPAPETQKISADLSHLIATSVDAPTIQKRAADLLAGRLGLYYAGIFLLDDAGEYAVLHYGTGEFGRQMLLASYRLAVGGYSLVGRVIKSGESQSTSVNEKDPTRFENPFLPDSNFEFALPLVSGGSVLGALDIHFSNAEGLSEPLRLLLQQSADMLAVALDKTTLVQRNYLKNRSSAPVALSKPISIGEIEKSLSYENPAVPQPAESTTFQIPLTLQGETIGGIELETGGDELSRQQKEFLEILVAQTAVALENASLLEQTLKKADRERKVLEISSKIRSTNDSRKMLQIALEELSRNLGVSKAQIVLNVPERPREPEVPERGTRTLTMKPTTGQLPELKER